MDVSFTRKVYWQEKEFIIVREDIDVKGVKYYEIRATGWLPSDGTLRVNANDVIVVAVPHFGEEPNIVY